MLYVTLRQYLSQECTVVNFQNYDVFDAESVELLLERWETVGIPTK